MGFIQTSPIFETSASGVFATGEVRAGSTGQVVSEVGEDVAVALMVRQYLENSQSGRGSGGT